MSNLIDKSMSKISIYLLFLLFYSSIIACSGDDGTDPISPVQPDNEWDKTRTAKIVVISDLTNSSPYNVANYSIVANIAAKNDRHITILDKTNITFGTTRLNPGAKIAVLAERYPIFVPVSKTTTEYIGSTLLFNNTVPQMEQTIVIDACRMLPVTVEIKAGLTVKVATLSFNAESQINASAPLLKSSKASSTLIIGTIKRNLFPLLESKLSSVLTDGSYEVKALDNSNKNSEYCIYIFGSTKWKFREIIETVVNGNIKSYMVQVENIK